jgi:hypothetical protein
MSLYARLLRIMSPGAAGVVFALTYTALILLILLFLPTPAADFRYGRY